MRKPAVGLEAGGSACTLWSCSEREGGKGPAYLPGCREWGPPGRRQGQINSPEQQRPQNSLFFPGLFPELLSLDASIMVRSRLGQKTFKPSMPIHRSCLACTVWLPGLCPPRLLMRVAARPSPSWATGPGSSSLLSSMSWALLPRPALLCLGSTSGSRCLISHPQLLFYAASSSCWKFLLGVLPLCLVSVLRVPRVLICILYVGLHQTDRTHQKALDTGHQLRGGALEGGLP